MGVTLLSKNVARVAVVMPVYNECESVLKIMSDVLALDLDGVELRLVVVESASTDGTREVLQGMPTDSRVQLVYQDHASGKGNALREGFGYVENHEIILIQDADLEYDTSDYSKLLRPIIAGESTFVLGSRHVPGQPIRTMAGEPVSSFVTNLGHAFFCALFNITYGVKLADPFTMYKIFPAEAIRGMRFDSDRFDFDWELAAKLIRTGNAPLEIPVTYMSRGFKQGKKVRLFRDPLTWVHAAVKFRLARVESYYQPPLENRSGS